MTATAVALVEPLMQLMQSHGIPCEIEREWVVPHGRLPAIRASWTGREGTGVLEVEVLLDDRSLINECFAGIGEGEAAIVDALRNFTINSFHVLLAAFWGVEDRDQVMVEEWTVSGNRFKACIGNFGRRGSLGVDPVVPHELFPLIQRTIERETLADGIHWVRHFFCDLKGERTFEALLDNEPWQAGLDAMQSIPWVRSGGYYSVRNFLVLLPIV
jgi:hypothetical protein